MIKYDYSQFNTLAVSGDIHGEFPTLIYNLKIRGIENTVIILAGDCAVGFNKRSYYTHVYSKLSEYLEKDNNILLLVRGNHDDPEFFDGKKINFERMKCIPDYSVVCAAGHKVLCVGGATSLDRTLRKDTMRLHKAKFGDKQPLYWEDETVYFDKKALDEIIDEQIDTVVTHTCPSFCFPTTKRGLENWSFEDPELLEDVKIERATMDQLYERLIDDKQPLQNWYYGHYHESHIELINDIEFHLLAINEITRVREFYLI